jgi:geranylgeranyl reductase family protein
VIDAPARTDVLVIGGGPAGASAAYWLARHGHDVTVVERKSFPREKTCGDGLTPRAVHQLGEMGLAEGLTRFHRYNGLRATGMGRELELEWPSHPVYPQHGYVVRRRELDTMVARNAEAAGARLLEGHEALEAIVERGFVREPSCRREATTARSCSARSAPSSSSSPTARTAGSVARSGTFRTREWPYGTAIRTYWESPRHAEPWIESALDVKDRNGNPMPGYGWIFPVGDGTINIGVGLLSTFRDFKSVNTTHLLDAYAHQIAERGRSTPAPPSPRRRAAGSRWAAPSDRRVDRPTSSSATPQAV